MKRTELFRDQYGAMFENNTIDDKDFVNYMFDDMKRFAEEKGIPLWEYEWTFKVIPDGSTRVGYWKLQRLEQYRGGEHAI